MTHSVEPSFTPDATWIKSMMETYYTSIKPLIDDGLVSPTSPLFLLSYALHEVGMSHRLLRYSWFHPYAKGFERSVVALEVGPYFIGMPPNRSHPSFDYTLENATTPQDKHGKVEGVFISEVRAKALQQGRFLEYGEFKEMVDQYLTQAQKNRLDMVLLDASHQPSPKGRM